MLYQKKVFKEFSDGRGELVPLEIGRSFNGADIPFDVKRCYFISVPTNEGNAVRGRHAHYNLEQMIICMNGSFNLRLEDGKGEVSEVYISKKNEGIYIKSLVWRELSDFSENCVILVLASQHFNESDYIRDYEKFIEVSNNNNNK